jgi:hypothetical protein
MFKLQMGITLFPHLGLRGAEAKSAYPQIFPPRAYNHCQYVKKLKNSELFDVLFVLFEYKYLVFSVLVFAKLPNRCNNYILHFEVRNVGFKCSFLGWDTLHASGPTKVAPSRLD